MLDSFKHQELLNKILDIQKDLYANEIGKTTLIKTHYIDEFSHSENSVRVIFDHVNLKVLHITENIEKLGGYSFKDFYDLNVAFLLKIFSLDHIDFMYVWIKWAILRHEKYGNSLDAKQAMCGIKAKHFNGRIIRLLIRQFPLETTEDGVPLLSALTLDDITHLMKADFYWGRIECGREKREIHHLTSLDKKGVPQDILSVREKNIVQLLAQGKESKEIGTELFISSHTVDNHRRNMINKIGVRDTTGLVQICRMTGII